MAYTGFRYYSGRDLPVVGDRVCSGGPWRVKDGVVRGPRVGIVVQTMPMTEPRNTWYNQKNFKVQWASGKVTWVTYTLLWHIEWLDERRIDAERHAIIFRQACERAHQGFREIESSIEISRHKLGA